MQDWMWGIVIILVSIIIAYALSRRRKGWKTGKPYLTKKQKFKKELNEAVYTAARTPEWDYLTSYSSRRFFRKAFKWLIAIGIFASLIWFVLIPVFNSMRAQTASQYNMTPWEEPVINKTIVVVENQTFVISPLEPFKQSFGAVGIPWSVAEVVGVAFMALILFMVLGLRVKLFAMLLLIGVPIFLIMSGVQLSGLFIWVILGGGILLAFIVMDSFSRNSY